MECMPYRTESALSGSPMSLPGGAGEENRGDMSVEELVLSMRQDLLVVDANASASATTTGVAATGGGGGGGHRGASLTVHRQPGAVSLRINGVGPQFGPEGSADCPEKTAVVPGRGSVSITQNRQHHHHHEHHVQQQDGHYGVRVTNPSPQQLVDDTAYPASHYYGHYGQPQTPDPSLLSYSQPPAPIDVATRQRSLSNGYVGQAPARPQLASQFYQQLRMSWDPVQPPPAGPAGRMTPGSVRPPGEMPVAVADDDEPDLSPRMLPKPPPEPRRGSGTRSSLRRAANLLLNRSRQSLSDGEAGRRPTPPSTPRDQRRRAPDPKPDGGGGGSSKSSPSIRERLQKNKSRMGDLLRSPNLSRVRRSSQGNVSTDSSLSPPDPYHQARAGHHPRKYASAENLSRTQTGSAPAPYGGRANGAGSGAYEALTPRSDDGEDCGSVRSQPPGYQLRRHSSGPVYQASPTIEKRSLHRGYHTADSDTDSGASRINMYSPHTQARNSVQKAMPSARDTLRLLSKKRETASVSSRSMSKSGSGPVRADHSIQPVSGPARMPSDRSPADVWTGQGARPKRSSSTESLETEDVRHEIFPDTPIRAGREAREGRGDPPPGQSAGAAPEESERRSTMRGSRPLSPSARGSSSRPASPSRSVHFEDSHLSPAEDQRSEPPSRPSSRQRRSPTDDDVDDRRQSNRPASSRTKSALSRRDEAMNSDRGSRRGRGSRHSDHSSREDSYSKVDDPFSKVDDPYSKVDDPYSKVDDPFSKVDDPYSKVDDPFSKVDDPFSKVDDPYSKVDDPYSKVDDPYSNVDSPHVRADPSHSKAGQRRSRHIADENPYEEVQVAVHGRGSPSSRPASSGNRPASGRDEADSVDALYAKVERKQRQRQAAARGERETERNNNAPWKASAISGGHAEPIYAKVDKSKKRPPSGASKGFRRRAQSDATRVAVNGNPCVADNFDDSIAHIDTHEDTNLRRSAARESDLSGSRLSLASVASVSDKVQSIGRATKKKLSSMRRALSMDRVDTAGRDNDGVQPKFKRSPSLRSLTGLFTKKDKKDSEASGELNKRRSASLSGLHVRPQRTSEETDVTSPSHLRKVGKLLHMNSDGSQTVELIKPPSGPFGFYIARGTSTYGSGVFVTRLGDGHPAKILAGLLAVGDEILSINGEDVRSRPINDVYDMMMDTDRLVLRLVPIATRNDYAS